MSTSTHVGASAGPSLENQKLRSALLSRTFDSQISFGSSAPREGHGSQSMLTGGSGGNLPPPAGGGRAARVAEGAAWTPGGRRHVLGSKVRMVGWGGVPRGVFRSLTS